MTDARLLADLHAAAESVWQDVVPLCPGFAVEVLPRIDSTNSELMRRARDGALHPLLLVAAEQNAGRGRQGRQWHSQAGAALTFSLGLPLQPAEWSGLSLAVGVALAEALHPQVQIKWPNDLCWQGRKLGGVLVETVSLGAQRYAVIGVGLNLVAPALPSDGVLGPGMPALPAAGLLDLMPDAAKGVGHWLRRVAAPLLRQALDFEAQGFAHLVPRYAARDTLMGRPVRLSDGREGVADGVRADGALWLATASGRSAVWQHEVSVRPC